MDIVYAALLLHSLGKTVDEAGVKKVVEAAGAKAEDAQIKALVSSLKDVNIDEAIKQAAVVQAAPQASAGAGKEEGEKKEEKQEEKQEEKAEEAAAGLGALFG
ncbi:MAG: 50S ribosomal protein P1 [Candidatus Aenigmarchaeota archaeon]|nr:50S ribosomal protein P1 [Candidatus Aenigmarchaeota archaeon]